MSKTLESMFIEMFEEVANVNRELTLQVKSLEEEIENLKKQLEEKESEDKKQNV